MRRQAGGTRADLIAITVILLVLAAVMYPIFAPARGGSRKSCLSHVKQLGLGMLMYLQDFDSVFPPENAARMPGRNWDDLLLPYVKNAGLFCCPTVEKPPKDRLPAGRVRGYAFNARILGWQVDGMGEPTADVAHPATTVVLCETHYRVRGRWWWSREYRVPATLNGPDVDNGNEKAGWKPLGEPGAVRHMGGSFYAFADGYAKWFRSEAVRSGDVPNDGKRPGFGL